MAVRIAKAAVLVIAVLVMVYLYLPSNYTGKVRAATDRDSFESFTLPDLQGQNWSLAEHRGEVVLVNFWATWCPPCREETPGLVRLAAEYNGRVAVVGIANEDPPEAVRKFVSEYQVPYPVLIPGGRLAMANTIENLPTTYLIDRTGRVAKTYVGGVREDVFRADIERLLAEAGA